MNLPVMLEILAPKSKIALPNIFDPRAKLFRRVPVSIGIPDHFTLVMSTSHARFCCRRMWRNEQRISVVFVA
jgi:hypothetical protein